MLKVQYLIGYPFCNQGKYGMGFLKKIILPNEKDTISPLVWVEVYGNESNFAEISEKRESDNDLITIMMRKRQSND